MKLKNSGLEFKGTPGDLSWDYETGYCGLKAGNTYVASMYGEGEDVCQASPDHVYPNVHLLQESKDMLVLLDETLPHLQHLTEELESSMRGSEQDEGIAEQVDQVKKLYNKVCEQLRRACYDEA